MHDMIHLQELQELCALPGISGRENAVRDWIIARLPAGAPYEIDALSNLIVNPANAKVLLCAHMDEVGFIVTHITEDGFVKFAHVGGISRAAYLGRRVLIGENRLPGIIGVTPIHLLGGDARSVIPTQEALYIDIGAENRAQAEQHVSPGDYVTFAPDFTSFGDNQICAKAIDDRIGCLILLELLRNYPGMCAVFTTREEVGGAVASAAHTLHPDYAIVLETTTAADLPGVSGTERVCALGAGAVVPFMDGGTVYPFDLYQRVMALAQSAGIPAQTKTLIAGGNDARTLTGAGIPSITISVPCRNLHSPSVVMQTNDAHAVYQLTELVWKELTAQ